MSLIPVFLVIDTQCYTYENRLLVLLEKYLNRELSDCIYFVEINVFWAEKDEMKIKFMRIGLKAGNF